MRPKSRAAGRQLRRQRLIEWIALIRQIVVHALAPLTLVGTTLSTGCRGGLRTAESPPGTAVGAVFVDPISALPHATDAARSGDLVATLRTPVASELVASIVRRIFEAFRMRSVAAIEPQLDDVIVDLRAEGVDASKSRYAFALDLQARMKAGPYDQLELDQMYRSQDVEVYAHDELGQPGRPARPPAMTQDDLLVRIPIVTSRLGADVLFGDDVRLLLRREGGRYKLRGYGEMVAH